MSLCSLDYKWKKGEKNVEWLLLKYLQMEGYDVWGLFQKMLVGGQVASAADGMGLATG